MLDELVKRLARFLVYEQHKPIGRHGLDQFIETQRFVISLIAIKEHGEVSIGIATARGPAIAFLEPAPNLRGLDDDA
jgi:hypothetical protein